MTLCFVTLVMHHRVDDIPTYVLNGLTYEDEDEDFCIDSEVCYPGGKVKKQTRPAVKGWPPETISTYI